jgi:hypothetical protein
VSRLNWLVISFCGLAVVVLGLVPELLRF